MLPFSRRMATDISDIAWYFRVFVVGDVGRVVTKKLVDEGNSIDCEATNVLKDERCE